MTYEYAVGWNGTFGGVPRNARLQKRSLLVDFDPENYSLEAIDNVDPDSVIGVMTVFFKPNGKPYRFEVTYQEYLEFEATDFDSSWLNENMPIFPPGDWGWSNGRTKQTGFSA